MSHLVPPPGEETPEPATTAAFAPVTDPDPAADPAADPAGEAKPSFWRSVPLWAWIVAGVALVALVVTALVVLLTPETPEPIMLDPETVTAAPPTPEVDPIPRQPATAFEEALPDVVRAYAVASDETSVELLAAGALEGRALTYTDGADSELALAAGQWETAEAADAYLTALLTTLAAPSETGTVTAQGEPVGRFVIISDGDASAAVWTNGTAVLHLTGPQVAVMEAYRAFPL